LGAKDRNEIRNDPFFKSIDFNKLYNQEYKPPITDFSSMQEDDDDQDDIGYKGKV
jgi:serum/glucocorticoid-regulated kinase 2